MCGMAHSHRSRVGEGGLEPPTSCSQSRCATTAPLPVGTPQRAYRRPGGTRSEPCSRAELGAGAAGTIVGAETRRRYTHASVKTTVSPLEGNKVKLSVEVDEDEFDKAITDAFRKISREVRIPGFRPGKAPRKVLERRLGPQIGREQALNDALPDYYAQDGLTADDYSYTLGSAMVTPEVDEQLRGAKAGDILEFDAAHPDPDEERQLHFRVLVKQVRERVMPDADDDWASENSEFESIDELRASICNRSLAVRQAQAQAQLRQSTGEALAKLVEVEAPGALIAHEMQHRAQDLALRLQAQGISPEQWLAMSGTSNEEFTGELKEAAQTAVKVDLALRAVADAERIECTDDDLEDELQAVAERAGEKVARVRKEFERGGQLAAVRSDVRKRKALDWLLERVEIVDEDGQPIERGDLEITPAADDQATAPGGDGDDTDDTETESE